MAGGPEWFLRKWQRRPGRTPVLLAHDLKGQQAQALVHALEVAGCTAQLFFLWRSACLARPTLKMLPNWRRLLRGNGARELCSARGKRLYLDGRSMPAAATEQCHVRRWE